FWWGFRPGQTQALYRQMFEVFTKQFRLDNLLWVWNANKVNDEGNAGPYQDYFPGRGYVDVLATDVYHHDYRESHYTQLLELAGGKPVALGEIGHVPDPSIFLRQPRWAWFMVWSDFLDEYNTHDAIRSIYGHSRIVHREDPLMV